METLLEGSVRRAGTCAPPLAPGSSGCEDLWGTIDVISGVSTCDVKWDRVLACVS
jgi:hypothetical protein